MKDISHLNELFKTQFSDFNTFTDAGASITEIEDGFMWHRKTNRLPAC